MFSTTNIVLSHQVKPNTTAGRPITFSLDLSSLLLHETSSLFCISGMHLVAYKAGTTDQIPIKYAALNGNATRVLTYDTGSVSSQWTVDLGGNLGPTVPIAGTNITPFVQSMAVYAPETRPTLLTGLSFMMSPSLSVADGTRRAYGILSGAKVPISYKLQCLVCHRATQVQMNTGPHTMLFPVCGNRKLCTPHPCLDPASAERALCDVMTLVHRLYEDKLEGLIPGGATMCNGYMSVPLASLSYMNRLYSALLSYTDGFAVVDIHNPTIKVLFESDQPVGQVLGNITITTLTGATVYDVYKNLIGQEEDDLGPCDEDEPQDPHMVTPQCLLRRGIVQFNTTSPMTMLQWRTHFYNLPL